ncbi:MAG: hypothetical protein ACRDN8_02490, partial [Thermoleophilaceae bacterium]
MSGRGGAAAAIGSAGTEGSVAVVGSAGTIGSAAVVGNAGVVVSAVVDTACGGRSRLVARAAGIARVAIATAVSTAAGMPNVPRATPPATE